MKKLTCLDGKSVFIKVIFYPAVFLSILLALLLVLQNNMPLFVFDREAVYQGEWWRLFTAHFTHSSSSHALWDVLAFFGVTIWLGQYSIKQVIISVFMGIAAVDILLLSVFSSLDYYCGLSGILFSPLLLVCYHYFQTNRGVVGLLPMAIICTKVVWEMCVLKNLFVDTGWQAYPEAHLAGLMGGLLCIAFLKRVLD